LSPGGSERALESSVLRAVSEARERLDALEAAREAAIRVSRDVVSSSGKAIAYMLSGKSAEAEAEFERLERAKRALDESLSGFPELEFSGFAQSAYAEYVEAVALRAVLEGRELPPPSALGVHPSAYLLGLADLVGELRRLCLERVRADDLRGAFDTLSLMESIYAALRELDYPDPLVPGLRHKVDAIRRSVEDIRTMLVDVENREKLRRALEGRA